MYKPSGFNYKYTGIYTGLDTLINIDGYYKSVERETRFKDKYHSNIMFYIDGLLCYSISDNAWKIFRDGIYPVSAWGTYRIIGDTIKCQFITDDGLMAGVNVGKSDYLIISSNEILELDTIRKSIPYSFHPLEDRIDSTNWLLKKGWFYEKKKSKN